MVMEQLDVECKRMNPDTELSPFAKIYSKLIIGSNVKCKTITLLEDKVR